MHPALPTELAIGELFADRYLVEATIGRGGMGTVYRVRDQSVGEDVALKILDFGGRDGKNALERFRREVRLSRRVTHPHVARTFDLGERDGLHYLTMELVEGTDLATRLKEVGPLPEETLTRYGLEIAMALEAAHEAGVIHRDLKPQNVLLDLTDRVKVTDFGIARPLTEEDGVQTLGIVGTPAYMAPEQVSGDEVDARTDIYALGVVLYELATGVRPFRGGSAMTIAVKRLEHAPPDPRSLRPIAAPLAETILRCLSRSPSGRPSSAREVADELRAFSTGQREAARTSVSRPGAQRTRPGGGPAPSTDARHEPRLAILPFTYRGPADDAFLGDSFTDELIDVLCRTRGLLVLASAATSSYRDHRDPRVIGRELNVDAVVDGTVQRAGSQIRISARLCDARSGVQLASERMDAELADIFDLQDKVSRRIAEVLRVNIASTTSSDGSSVPSEAVELYLRARKQLNDLAFDGEDGALTLLEQALQLAPDFAPAAAAHAIACVRAWFVPDLAEGRNFEPAARAAVARALEIAPHQPETHMADGLLAKTDGDHRRAVFAYRNALEIAPTYAGAVEGLGIMECESGRRERGMSTLWRALEIEPTRALSLLALAREHAHDGDFEEFDRIIGIVEETPQGKQIPMYQLILRVASWRGDLHTARRVLDLLPRRRSAARDVLAIYARGILGDLRGEALLRAGREVVESSGNPRFRTLIRQLATEVTCLTGHFDEAFFHLEAAARRDLVDLSWLELCPALAPVRDDPRFANVHGVVRERVERIWIN